MYLLWKNVNMPNIQKVYNKEQLALGSLFSLKGKDTQAIFASIIMTTGILTNLDHFTKHGILVKTPFDLEASQRGYQCCKGISHILPPRSSGNAGRINTSQMIVVKGSSKQYTNRKLLTKHLETSSLSPRHHLALMCATGKLQKAARS